MEREQYAVMARREDDHWWYAGMRRVALSVLDQTLAGRSGLLVLDAGCGTGGTTIRLRQYGRVVGLDLAWEALQPARARGLDGFLARGDVERLPFRDASFDVATSFEVVYHLGVANDEAALAELRRVLKPGGLLLLRVPAHDWLRGAHDRLVHTRHRYSPAEVRTKLAQARFAVDRLAWANSLLFPAALAKRLLLERRGQEQVEPDLWQPPRPVNAILESLVTLEAVALARGSGFPFGLSVLAVARAV